MINQSKLIDLTGKKFGRLLVIERVAEPIGKDYSYYWLCDCECGCKKKISGHSLRSGRTLSCGCLKREKAKELRSSSLVGQQFGYLTVLSKSDKNTYYLCQCKCGNTKLVHRRSLVRGNTQSCGCLAKEIIKKIGHHNFVDITGNKYGKLTAIKYHRSTNGYIIWTFRCECGVEKILNTQKVKDGRIKTCGCGKRLKQKSPLLKEYGHASSYFAYSIYRRGAKKRKLNFDITFEEFKNICSQNCFYCGTSPSNILKSRNNNGDFIYNGIDRINSNIGYQKDNIRPSCFQCNRAKNTMSDIEFKNWINRTFIYQNKNLNHNEQINQFLDIINANHENIPRYCHTTKKFNNKVIYAGFYWDRDELVAAIESLLFENWFVSGPSITKFEREFSNKVGNHFGVMVNSGSSANLVALAALKRYYNWDSSSNILVSACSFPTTVSVIPQNGLQPKFVDIEMDTLNVDLKELESKIDKYTKAILISPVLGASPDYDKLLMLSNKYNIILIGDLCDSVGSMFKDKLLSEFNVINTYSFFASHHFSVGNGGMITTNNEELSILCRKISRWFKACYCKNLSNTAKNGECGKRFSNWLNTRPDIDYDHRMVFDGLGYNLQNLSITGAIGLAQLKKWDVIHNKRQANHNQIEKIFLKHLPQVNLQKTIPNSKPSWFGCAIICPSRDFKEQLVLHLETNGINTRPYFSGNILCHNEFSQFGDWKLFPNSTLALELVFFIGVAPHITDQHIDYIEDVVKNFRFQNHNA
jgi:CDP-6-deoxy-D-xylo-4-hexulose-3-dehydrase